MSTKRRMYSPNILVAWLVFQVAALCQASPPDGEPPDLPCVYRTWQTFTTGDGLPNDNILAVHVAGEQVWVGTAGGLALHEADAWTSWTAQEGLPWPMISAIDIDTRTRDVWLGTWGGGLIRFSGGRFDQFNQFNSGLAGNLVFAVAVVGDRVWAATNSGLSSLSTVNNTWDLHFERRADAPETAIINLDLDDRYLYAAPWCGRLRQFDLQDGTWSVVTEPASGMTTDLARTDIPSGTTLAAAVAVERSLWWATLTNLLRRDHAGKWEMRRIGGQNAPGSFVNCLAAPSDSVAWLGTDRGLEVLADWFDGTWVTYRRCENGSEGRVTASRNGRILDARILKSTIPDNRIRCIAFQNDDVWVGTSRGLARGTGMGRWTGLRPAPANPSPSGKTAGSPTVNAVPPPLLSDDEPDHLEVVNIAVLRPGDRAIAVPGNDSPGATRLGQIDRMAIHLAIEQANARGGYRGQVPFALTTGPVGFFSGWGWTTPEDDFPAIAQKPNAWGIVGYLGSGSRFATAVALRTEVPVVNFAPTPPTTDEVINPWIFRCRGNDPWRHRLLLEYVFDGLGYTRLAVLRTTGQLGKRHLDWWSDDAAARGHPVVADLRYDPATNDLTSQLQALQRSGAEVVLTWCDVPLSATILREMRESGMSQLFVGSGQIISDDFIASVGPEPGPVIAAFPQATLAHRQTVARFAEDYTARFMRPSGPDAFRVFTAVNHLLEAINIAGLDREAIRQTLLKMHHDAGGERHCEQIPRSAQEVILGHLQGGNWTLCSLSDLGIESP